MATVLITGCSSGFGRLAALRFAHEGHTVVATMRTPSKGKDLLAEAEASGLDLRVITLDVTDEASVQTAIAEAVAAVGPLDVVVNNAGIELRGPIEQASEAEVHAQFDTNVFGLLRVLRAVVPAMRERRAGVIVNVGSIAGLVARPYGGLYAATKHAVEAITEALHYELAPFGVRVAVIEPGQFATELLANALVADAFTDTSPYWTDSEIFDTKVQTLVPGGEPADPGPVVDAIVHAALDPTAPLRSLVGADAELIMAVRAGSDFETFEQTMRTSLDWWA